MTPAPLTTSDYDIGCGALSVSLQGLDSTIASASMLGQTDGLTLKVDP